MKVPGSRVLFVGVVALVGCSRDASSPVPPCDCSAASANAVPTATSGTTTSTNGPVNVDFQNVRLHVADGVVLEVRHLQGALNSVHEGAPPNFDDVRSYSLRIDAGEIAMAPDSLTHLLNGRVFNYAGAPITNAEVSIENGHIVQKGTLHKGVAVPFSIEAAVGPTEDGRIELRPIKVKAAGMPAGGFMKLFHLHLDDLVRSNPGRGFETRGDNVVLDPRRMLPAPQVNGKITAVRIDGDRIVQIFGKAPAGRPHGVTGNYMSYRGNVLRFGRLTMTETDMRLIDADPRDPFDFSPTDYVRQLVAGYSKNSADGSLRVFMPDYDDAMKGASAR